MRGDVRLPLLLLTALAPAVVLGCGEEEPADTSAERGREGAEGREDGKRSPSGGSTDGGREPTARGNSARVTEVIDGDTVEMERLGRVRLIGVDTPEQGSCYDDAATRFTRERIGGEVVRYELGEERKDPYGRTLAYIYQGGVMHNVALLEKGYAEVLTIAPNDRYAGRFESAERSGRQNDEGLWGACGRSGGPGEREGGDGDREPPGSGGWGGGRLPPPPPDLDCSDVSGPVPVGPDDPHRLDADEDGVGCE